MKFNIRRALILLAAWSFSVMPPVAAQTPKAPPQPAAATYGLDKLNLLPTYDRTKFQATFKYQPAAFDSKRAPKAWFDGSLKCTATSGPVMYKVWQLFGIQARQVFISLPCAEAATVNLPGKRFYAMYTIPPSGASIVCAGCTDQKINPMSLATRAQAEQLLAAFGELGVSISESNLGGPWSYRYDPTENRRVYQIGVENVGFLLYDRNWRGVNAPGHWLRLNDGTHKWIPHSEPDGSTNTAPFVPVPVRPLLPNEKIVTGLMGSLIERTGGK